MKKLLKNIVLSTPLEPWARKVLPPFNRLESTEEPFSGLEMNDQYDKQTIEVMKRVLKSSSNAIDVGCHQGSILREILQFAPGGTHFAFEPLPELHQGLLESFANIQRLHIYNCALSDTIGSNTFQHVVSNPSYSGLRKRRYDHPHEEVQEITVQTELLDNLIPRDLPIDFIKVDVEGAELQVFKGAVETIKKSRPVIIFEHGLGAADHYETTPENIYDLLANRCGLRLFLMANWLKSNGNDFLSRDQFCQQFYDNKNYYFLAAA